jgi:predicted phosphodiesterase
MRNFISGPRLLRFAVVADSHLNPVHADNTSPWQTNHLANPRNQVVVDAINKIDPAFTIHVGDVVHPLPHTADYDGATAFANTLYGGLKAPFYIAPGNHDIGDKHLPGNPAACISQDSCEKYEHAFGAQWQAFTHGNVCFVIINTCLFGSGLPQEDTQWQFLQERLKAEVTAGRRIFLFTHYPPFVTEPDEENHYDNIDQKPRQRLLQLTSEAGVEALFAGHVHTFFLNCHEGMWTYALPSSTNFRQDYAELFRIEPDEELGRNDLGKFGFFIVDIHETGHIARFVRTYGTTEASKSNDIALSIGTDVREHNHPTIGADFCHDWARIEALPYNPPLDAFVRKRVRNDYYALNLWDAGIRNIRVPIHDIVEDNTYRRIQVLCALGHRITAFGTQVPPTAILERLATLGSSLESYEWIGPKTTPSFETIALFATHKIPLYVAPVLEPTTTHSKGNYDHTMTCGLAIAELEYLENFKSAPSDNATGVVVRIGYEEELLESIQLAVAQSTRVGTPISLHIKLSNKKSSHINNDDQAIALRVAEAALAKSIYPRIPMTLDTFMDIDRGYFARNGLVDRRNNPRPASNVLRHLSNTIGNAPSIGFEHITREAHQLSVRLKLNGKSTELVITPNTIR